MNFRILAPLAIAAAVAACAPYPPQPSPSPAPGTPSAPPHKPAPAGGWPTSAEQVSGAAVVALLNQAQGEEPQQAAASLERALRIEPRNAFVWQALAQARVRQNLPADAESAAQKSSSLANGNPYVEAVNWQTVAEARRMRGDEAGAAEADGKAAALQELLGH